jgi:hypothetical protein
MRWIIGSDFRNEFDHAMRRQSDEPFDHRGQRDVPADCQMMHDGERDDGVRAAAGVQSKPFGLGPTLLRARIGRVGEQRQETEMLDGGARYRSFQRIEVEIEADDRFRLVLQQDLRIFAGIAPHVPGAVGGKVLRKLRDEVALPFLFFLGIGVIMIPVPVPLVWPDGPRPLPRNPAR